MSIPVLDPASVAKTKPASGRSPSQRLVSLDVFRGGTMALMVLVNNPGTGRYVYGPLRHSQWNGWTITDLVFPFFLWMVGLALTLSFSKRLSAGAPRRCLLSQAVRRAVIIYALGLFIYLYPEFNFSTMRLLGVLQRIAICYLIASAIYLFSNIRGQIAAIVTLLVSYWLIMKFAPVPGVGSGFFDLDRNFAHYVDSLILGRHNYASTRTWDPEGIVSTLPAIATTLFGIMAGHAVRAWDTLYQKAVALFVTGNLLLAAGAIMDIALPINKKLWTSSYCVFTAGLAFVVFAICLWAVDIRGWRFWTKPFAILGMNAITIYFLSEVVDETLVALRWRGWIYNAIFAPLASPINASLLYAVAYVLVMFAIAYFMYRRRWFVRV